MSQSNLRGNGIQHTGSGSFVVGRDVNIIAENTRDVLSELDDLPEAAFNASSKQHLPSCLKNTRRDILDQIERWVADDGDKHIYWLKGMAGTGKSTIARTIARKYNESKHLGASFFFSRGGGDLASVARFAPTIAIQLAYTSQALNDAIKDAVASNRFRNMGLFDQWKKLVLEPLATIDKDALSSPIVFVIDALDECDDEDEICLLIQCLVDATAIEGVRLRVFVTSRPDAPVNFGFSGVSRDIYQGFILHDIEQSIVDQDLTLYYKHELGKTKQRFGLGDRIDSDDTIQALVEKSNGLFIHAATVCRFIFHGEENGDGRLSIVLDAKDGPIEPEKELDRMYTTVLVYPSKNQHNGEAENITHLRPEEQTKREVLFKEIIGAIVVLSHQMSRLDLATVLNQPVDIIRKTLHRLHSVLDVPEDENQVIRLLHPSFRDFLIDPNRCQAKMFFIDAQTTHQHLFNRSLRLITENLQHQDICNFRQPSLRARSVSKADITKHISLPVQYACRFWIHHLLKSEVDLINNHDILSFFQNRFLFWLETLAWIGRLSDGITLLKLLETKLATSDTSDLPLKEIESTRNKTRGFLSKLKLKLKRESSATSLARHTASSLYRTVYDAMRFFLSHCSIIEDAPLQLYCSALIFSPEQSLIRQLYSNQIPHWVTMRPLFAGPWSLHLQTLVHPSPVLAVAFSPDGRLIASGAEDETIRLWDAVTGTENRTLQGHSGKVSAVAYSPNGRLIASGGNDNTLRLWNTVTGTEYHALTCHSGIVNSVTFSPDSLLVALGASDNTVRLLNVATGAEYRTLRGHDDWVRAVAFSPDGLLIASGADDQTIRLWDVATGTEHSTLKGHAGWVRALAFSPDGRFVASGADDNTLRLWDVATGTKYRTLKGHVGWVTAVAFSPDGRLIASSAYDYTVRLWDAVTGTERRILQGHSYPVNAVTFSPDGRLIASGGSDKTIRLWDTATGTDHRTLQDHSDSISAVTYSPDGRLVASRADDISIRLWNAETGTEYLSLKGHSALISAIAFSPDGRLIASGAYDSTIRLWDAASGTEYRSRRGLSDPVHGVVFSPDGQSIAWAVDDNTVRLCYVDTGAVHRTFQGHYDRVRVVAFSPDGRLIASGAYDKTIRLWDVATGTERRTIQGHLRVIRAVEFSPDGLLIASGAYATVQLWDVATGSEQHTLVGHTDWVRVVAFSPDSQLIASAADDKTIRLWSTTTGAEACVFHIGFVPSCLRFSSCGTHLNTDHGPLWISSTSSPSPSPSPIFVSGSWIQFGDREMLRIHHDYRDRISFVFSDGVVFDNQQSSRLQLDRSGV